MQSFVYKRWPVLVTLLVVCQDADETFKIMNQATAASLLIHLQRRYGMRDV